MSHTLSPYSNDSASVTKVTTFNITLNKYQTFNINPKHPSKIPDYPNASGKF